MLVELGSQRAARPATESARSRSRWVRLAHRLGAMPVVYSGLRSAMGGDRYWSHLVDAVAQIRPGERVLDVGCGPAGVLEHLPDVEYVGVDHNARYVRHASAQFGSRHRFVHAEAKDLQQLDGEFDVVLAMGLLHHLSDPEALSMLNAASDLLADDGRMVTADVVAAPTSVSASWLRARDRGAYVRDADGYRALLGRPFEDVAGEIDGDLLHVPLTGSTFPLFVAVAAGSRRETPRWEMAQQPAAPATPAAAAVAVVA